MELRPDSDAQREHDPLCCTSGDKRLADLVDEVDERHQQEDTRGGEQDERRALRDAVIEAGFHQDRARQCHQSVDDHQKKSEEQRPSELGQQARQAEPGIGA